MQLTKTHFPVLSNYRMWSVQAWSVQLTKGQHAALTASLVKC